MKLKKKKEADVKHAVGAVDVDYGDLTLLSHVTRDIPTYNCEEFVPGPLLAMLRIPLALCESFPLISSLKFSFQ